MDTTTPRPIVNAHAVIPPWDQLTDAQRFRYAGNTDPWSGPVDPVAQERELERHRRSMARPSRQELEDNTCGCWRRDCADCGARIADGKRPAKGNQRAWSLRQDASLQQAKEGML